MRTKLPYQAAIALLMATRGALPAPSPAQEKARFSSLQDALRASGALAGGAGPPGGGGVGGGAGGAGGGGCGAREVDGMGGGKRFSFTIAAEGGGEEIRAHDPGTGRDTLLFAARGLTFPGTSEPFEYESFQWAEDSRHLVFQTRFQPLYRRSGIADYYVYRLADGSLTLAARGARTAELSPDGAMLGYERDGDLFVYDMAAGRETRLTRDASETVYHGHFDWVYEEEFGLAQAWNWSPDSRFIAYWQLDESGEPGGQV